MASKNGFESSKKGIGKLKPIPLSQLMDQWRPKEWIVDLFGAKVLLFYWLLIKDQVKLLLSTEWPSPLNIKRCLWVN